MMALLTLRLCMRNKSKHGTIISIQTGKSTHSTPPDAVQTMSEEKGKYMDSPASKSQIRKFIKNYEGQILLDDIADDLDSFSTFNAFFYRKLKPGCRPIADSDNDAVMTSAADCRMIAFDTVADSRKFWIKVG